MLIIISLYLQEFLVILTMIFLYDLLDKVSSANSLSAIVAVLSAFLINLRNMNLDYVQVFNPLGAFTMLPFYLSNTNYYLSYAVIIIIICFIPIAYDKVFRNHF
jgi:hypothetical protein